MTAIETMKLNRFLTVLGDMSSTEALTLAIEAEAIAKDLGVHDIAYPRFRNEARGFEDFAVLLEKAGK